MKDFYIGEVVRINTPGESHDKRLGKVVWASTTHVLVYLGDVEWRYLHSEVDSVE